MELLFISVDDYRGQKDLTFNLSNSHNFDYNFATGKLKWDILKNNNGLFFDTNKIISLKAIVGQNGVGKTSILELIQRMTYEFGSISSRLVFGFREGRKVTVKYYGGNYREPLPRPKLSKREQDIIKNLGWAIEITEYNYLKRRIRNGKRLTDSNFDGLKEKVGTVYFSNTYDGNVNFIINELNISTNKIAGKTSLRKYQQRELTDAIEFVQNSQDLFDDNDKEFIVIPDSIIFDLNTDNRYNSNTLNSFKDAGINFREINLLLIQPGFMSRVGVHDYFLIRLGWKLLLKALLILNRGERKVFHTYFHSFQIDLISNLEEHQAKVIDLFKSVIYSLPNEFPSGEKLNKDIERIKTFYKYSLESDQLDVKRVSEGESIDENFEIWLNPKTTNYIQTYLKLITFNDSTIQFRWQGRSSGEVAMLNFLSRLYSVQNKVKQEAIILLLDECDLYLHPDWQRRFVKILVKFVSKIFYSRNIQIIITTHSPIILSDLTKANVIFLEKRMNGITISDNNLRHATFGANIHSLYSDSFFLRHGIIGALSKDKINDLFDFLTGDAIEKSYTQTESKTIIDSVGDRIVQGRLLELYGDKFETEIEKEKLLYQKERIERQLRELDK